MRLIEIAEMSAEGILREWEKWEGEAGGRAQDAQDPEVYAALMLEFVSAEIEEQMTVAFNRGYKAAEAIARSRSEGIDRISDRDGAIAFNVVDVVEEQCGNERAKEFTR